MQGKLITFEGIDGSGKGTQSNLLQNRLEALGIATELFSFPCYENTFFGKEIGAFLRGEFGGINDVHPKLASILYAMDRLELKEKIINGLNEGKAIICDRYVDSNIAHQSSKLPFTEQANFILWIEKLEYGFNQMPKPDITFFLNVPIEVSKDLVLKKQKRNYTDSKEDIHEQAYGYLEKVYNAYLNIDHGSRWRSVDCCENGLMLKETSINDTIFNMISKELNLYE